MIKASRTQVFEGDRKEINLSDAPFVTTSMGTGSQPWSPWTLPPETREFVALTGFINRAGWDYVAPQIRKVSSNSQRLEEGSHSLIFVSLTGLYQQSDPDLVQVLHEFAVEMRGVVEMYVCPDHGGKQMHAKALACLLEGGDAITRIGSANLTGAGLNRNKEIEAVLTGREHYDRVRAATQTLMRHARNLADGTVATELSLMVQEAQSSLAPPLEPPAVGRGGSSEDQRAYAEAVAWLRGGLRLSAQHQNDEFAVSFSLDRYIKAGLIKHGEASDEATGIRFAADRRSIHVPLLPEHQKKTLKELNQALGRILGRYVVPMVGVSWCRVEWVSALEREWRETVGAVNHAALEEELKRHIKVLQETILRKDDRWYAVAKLLQHRQPAEWDREAAQRILGPEAVERCLSDSEQAQNAIAAVVLDELYQAVRRHLNIEYLQGLIRNVGERPHKFPHDPVDLGSVFEAILDLLSLGVLPRLRCGGAWKARSNGLLGKELLRRFSNVEDAFAVHAKVIYYKRMCGEPDAERSLPMAALWETFCDAYQILKNPIDWHAVVLHGKSLRFDPKDVEKEED